MAQLFALAERIEYSAVGTWIGESQYAYPVITGIHLIGLVVAVGLLFVVDFRILGRVLRPVPVHDLAQQLRPWIIWGFVAVYVSGVLLFWSSAARMLDSPAFVAKVLLLVIGTANALHFELVLAKSPSIRENHAVQPSRLRAAAVVSLITWTLVIVFGRLTAYMTSWTALGL